MGGEGSELAWLTRAIQVHIPKYLSPDSKDELLSELEQFPEGTRYYLHASDLDKALQGDACEGMTGFAIRGGKPIEAKGVVLSNSCDIDPANLNARPRNVIFSPLLDLQAFIKLLKDKGFDASSIHQQVDAIRRQKVTQLFYLPELPDVIPECVVVLDNVMAMPLENFASTPPQQRRVFRLSQAGHYLLILKLAIHFTRIWENVDRASTVPSS